MTDRCSWSDLPPEMCAHCLGHDARGLPAGELYRPAEVVRAVVVWPIKGTRPPARYPAPPEEPTDDPRVQVARDLRAIRSMAERLEERALDLAGDPHLPGGDALVNIAPVGNLEAWGNRITTTEDHHFATCTRSDHTDCRYAEHVADEDPDALWPPSQMLEFWSGPWRRDLDMERDERPTLASEANFLGYPEVLDWAWRNEVRFEDFASDMAIAKAKMENLVRDGLRETRSRILCNRCQNPKRLIRKWAKGDRPDLWKAPCCKAEFTDNEAKRAHAEQMRSAGAERWVEINEAVAALRVQGWPERTVRRWMEPLHHSRDRCTECGQTWPAREFPACPAPMRVGECGGFLVPVWSGSREAVIESWCDPIRHRVFVWWPSVWQRHLLATHDREARILARTTAV